MHALRTINCSKVYSALPWVPEGSFLFVFCGDMYSERRSRDGEVHVRGFAARRRRKTKQKLSGTQGDIFFINFL